ncbi:alpha/beta-hydrolase [Ganoderma leucocontextum]|nr:alpha/beta-hydrolase [Ganoderma leucocontextum]
MPFASRNQPFSTIYTIVKVVYTLAALPVWFALDAMPAARPRKSWPLKRALIAHIARTYVDMLFQTSLPAPVPSATYERDAKALGFVWVPAATPELVVGEVGHLAQQNGVTAERVGGFWYGPRDSNGNVGQRAVAGEKVVYHLHGGGHAVDELCRPRRHWQPRGYLHHLGLNFRMFMPEYRLSSAAPFEPANPFPASLLDAIAGYRYLVEDVGFDPRHIILCACGDSAGERYRLQPRGTSRPRTCPPSPGPSSIVRNSRSDIVHGFLESGYTRGALVGNLPEETAATRMWISPRALHAEWRPGMLSGFPRTVIVAGGAEYTWMGCTRCGIGWWRIMGRSGLRLSSPRMRCPTS